MGRKQDGGCELLKWTPEPPLVRLPEPPEYLPGPALFVRGAVASIWLDLTSSTSIQSQSFIRLSATPGLFTFLLLLDFCYLSSDTFFLHCMACLCIHHLHLHIPMRKTAADRPERPQTESSRWISFIVRASLRTTTEDRPGRGLKNFADLHFG